MVSAYGYLSGIDNDGFEGINELTGITAPGNLEFLQQEVSVSGKPDVASDCLNQP